MTPYDGQRVVVAGLGVSGLAVARELLRAGARVLVVDARDDERTETGAAELRAGGAELRLGDAETPVDADLIVTSPGWRPDQPMLAAAVRDGIEVIGEPELAWRLRPIDAAPWVAVTGTNGKTTTVGMVEAILRAAGYRTVAAGNVGRPLIEVVLDPSYDVLAVELSSFQLYWSRDLAPDAGVVLNLAEDHLDWHGSLDAYGAAKAGIWRGNGCGAYNADDPLVTRLALEACDDPHPFTVERPVGGGFGVADGVIVDGMSGVSPDEPRPVYTADNMIPLVAVADLQVRGPHNVANAVAAAAVSRVFGLRQPLPWMAVGEGLRAYRPGRHRNELVASGGGVDWVDDSKATNPHAAAASLSAYPSVVWIAGGLLKGATVDDLIRDQGPRLRGVVLIGQDRAVIAAALARHAADVPVVTVETQDTDGMNEAVRHAAELAQPGDTVLLAPAAASMDMFRDYAERGDRFAAAARAVAGP
ncbi:MAG: UDP-N-acetylmuramoyl-L-alanine--D-glutamate ligase [Frankiaceae bacterium]|nr:UDP-N-acetylmuramoyl-L-alanine--D-glutamate ligase [Frankiaceae bacterium]MBV9870393.1 UDP-N-acetylmuramoyl-L-alanine--D-glutamate ligase [Frankiaceae bacterium]